MNRLHFISPTTKTLWGKNKRLILVFLTLTFGVALELPTVQAAPGNLDLSFNGTGKSRFGFGYGSDFGAAIAVQADGKIVVAGTSYNLGTHDFSVVRYNPDGTPDLSFGTVGEVITPIGTMDDFGTAVWVQVDGKIVVAGYSEISQFSYDFAVVRYNPDGSLDNSFGAGGKVVTPNTDEANAMWIQSDGKIVIAGCVRNNSGSYDDFAVARYQTNGALDTSFDGDGIVRTPIGTYGDQANALTIQPDGKIVVVGYSQNASFPYPEDFAVVRYNANGSLDTSFDGDGKQTTPIGASIDIANGVALQINNLTAEPLKIVVVGYSSASSDLSNPNHDFAIVRYNVDGSLDTSFDGDGKLTADIGGFDDYGEAVIVQSNRFGPTKIIVGGYSNDGLAFGNDFAVTRFFLDGAPDTAFDGDGKVKTPIGGSEDIGAAMAFHSGKIVVAGYSFLTPRYDFALVRYNDNGSLDNTFDSDGKRTDDIGNFNATAKNVAIQSDGKIVAVGLTRIDDSIHSNHSAIARFNSNGLLDTSFSIDGRVSSDYGVDQFNGVAIQTDGKIVAAGFAVIGLGGSGARRGFKLVRYNPNGSLDSSFGTNGEVTTPVETNYNGGGNAVAIQSDGKIIVAGSSFVSTNDQDFAIVRYNPNGTLDNSFDGDGKVITPLGTNTDIANAIAIQSDGKIVVTGIAGSTFAAARYNPDGSLDNSFNFDGKVTTPVGSGTHEGGKGLAIQSNNKIVVAGTTLNNSTYDFAVVRYNTDGLLDTSFDADGIALTPVGTGNDYGTGAAIQSDGKIFVAGSSNGDFAVVRYNADGSLDNSYGGGGKIVVDVSDGGNDLGNAIALDSTGRAIVAGEANNLFGVVRLIGDNSLVSISGVVSYGTSATQKFVSGVSLTTTGASATSNSSGAYLLENLTFGGNYTVTPLKSGNANGISALDATLILRHVASGETGESALSVNQQSAADANNNGAVSALDATMILRFVAAGGQQSSQTGQTGNWKFQPASRNYPTLNNSLSDQDYTAILIGEVNGNWQPPTSYTDFDNDTRAPFTPGGID